MLSSFLLNDYVSRSHRVQSSARAILRCERGRLTVSCTRTEIRAEVDNVRHSLESIPAQKLSDGLRHVVYCQLSIHHSSFILHCYKSSLIILHFAFIVIKNCPHFDVSLSDANVSSCVRHWGPREQQQLGSSSHNIHIARQAHGLLRLRLSRHDHSCRGGQLRRCHLRLF